MTAEKMNLADLMATLLETPQCPASVRDAITSHVRDLVSQTDLTSPDIIRLLYPHLSSQAETDASATVAEGGTDAESGLEEILGDIDEPATAQAGTNETSAVPVTEAQTEQASAS